MRKHAQRSFMRKHAQRDFMLIEHKGNIGKPMSNGAFWKSIHQQNHHLTILHSSRLLTCLAQYEQSLEREISNYDDPDAHQTGKSSKEYALLIEAKEQIEHIAEELNELHTRLTDPLFANSNKLRDTASRANHTRNTNQCKQLNARQDNQCKQLNARQDNLATGIADLFGGSDDLQDFAVHLNSPDEQISPATDLIAQMIKAQSSPEEFGKQINSMSEEEIKEALEKIPNPQDEVDRIMQERRLQSLVIENTAQSTAPIKFITEIDGQKATEHESQPVVDEPPPANALSSLTLTQRNTLLSEIYYAAKNLVEQMSGPNLTAEQTEQMVQQQADRMLSAYLEKNKKGVQVKPV